MKTFLSYITVFLLGLYGAAAADPPRPLTFPPRDGVHLVLVTEAVDGDTVRFCWLVQETARLYGINTPETKGATAEAGKAAKQFLAGKLPAKPVSAKVLGRDKYGRVLMDVSLDDGKSLSALMIESGHAKAYFGEGPRP